MSFNNLDMKTNCLDYIDAICYINLDHRVDRLDHIVQEIKKIDPTLSKTHRINAEHVPSNGALGCSLSHIRALKLFLEHPEWNTCMILEDDFTFVSSDYNIINNNLLHLFQNSKTYDVMLLAYGSYDFSFKKTNEEHIIKIISSQTTSGYIIHRNYIYTLLANYILSSNHLLHNGRTHIGCLDQYWKRLMPIGNWYSFHNRIGYQYANYSDIERGFHDYGC